MMRKWSPWLVVVALYAVAPASAPAKSLAPYSGLDRSFGGGSVLLPGSGKFRESTANRCVSGPSGEVYVELTTHRYVRTRKGRRLRTGRIELAKISSRGKQVRGFGRGGRLSWAQKSRFAPKGFAVDGVGRLLILSRTPTTKAEPNSSEVTLTRVSADGKLDATYGVGGRVSLGKLRLGVNFQLLPDGRVTIASTESGNDQVVVLDATGNRATGFNSGQPVAVDFVVSSITSILVGGAPVLVVAGTRTGPAPNYLDTGVLRFLAADGGPAHVFGTTGELTVDAMPTDLASSMQSTAAKFVSHELDRVQPNALGGLDLAIESSGEGGADDGSVTWVRRITAGGVLASNYGFGGGAKLFESYPQGDFASGEFSFEYAVPLADDAWLAVSMEALYDHDTVIPGSRNLYFGAARLAPDGKSIKPTGFGRTKQPYAAEPIDFGPSYDGKSIVWCGHTGFRSRSGKPRAVAWVSRAPMG